MWFSLESPMISSELHGFLLMKQNLNGIPHLGSWQSYLQGYVFSNHRVFLGFGTLTCWKWRCTLSKMVFHIVFDPIYFVKDRKSHESYTNLAESPFSTIGSHSMCNRKAIHSTEISENDMNNIFWLCRFQFYINELFVL